jgi:hypothetical protein
LRRLLLLLVLLLLRILATALVSSAHAANQSTDAGTNRSPLARITTDGAANSTHRGTASGATEKPALRRLYRRRRGRGLWRTRGVVSCLLLSPSMTLVPITIELFRTLSFGRIDIELLCSYVTCHAQTHQPNNDLPLTSFHFCYSSQGTKAPVMRSGAANSKLALSSRIA